MITVAESSEDDPPDSKKSEQIDFYFGNLVRSLLIERKYFSKKTHNFLNRSPQHFLQEHQSLIGVFLQKAFFLITTLIINPLYYFKVKKCV